MKKLTSMGDTWLNLKSTKCRLGGCNLRKRNFETFTLKDELEGENAWIQGGKNAMQGDLENFTLIGKGFKFQLLRMTKFRNP